MLIPTTVTTVFSTTRKSDCKYVPYGQKHGTKTLDLRQLTLSLLRVHIRHEKKIHM